MQGGKRKNNVSEAGAPVLSVITVVFNSEQLIARTIESVLGQTYPHIEYVIIDGGSTDGTLNIIRSYDDRIAFWISEKDKGIYDAMNKGLLHATGDYVLYMNAGDLFFAEDTVEKVFASGQADVYYGDTEIIDTEGRSLGKRRLDIPRKLTWKSLKKGMLVCHQALFVKRAIAPQYDLQYKISSDVDWEINVLKNAATTLNTGLYHCKFLKGGLSKVNHKKSLRERFIIMSRHYGLLTTLAQHVYIVFRYAWHQLIRKPN